MGRAFAHAMKMHMTSDFLHFQLNAPHNLILCANSALRNRIFQPKKNTLEQRRCPGTEGHMPDHNVHMYEMTTIKGQKTEKTERERILTIVTRNSMENNVFLNRFDIQMLRNQSWQSAIRSRHPGWEAFKVENTFHHWRCFRGLSSQGRADAPPPTRGGTLTRLTRLWHIILKRKITELPSQYDP